MAKITWEISREGYGFQVAVVANTRADAIASAEAQWLQERDWETELVGTLNDDGTVFARSPVPVFTAKKVCK